MQSILEGGAGSGEPFSVVVKSGERLTGTVVTAFRRLGRKRGAVAQYRVELAAVSATPEFYNGGDPAKLGQSQN